MWNKFCILCMDRGLKSLLPILAVSLLVLALSQAFSQNQQIRDYVLEGNKQYEKNAFKKAAALYREAIKHGQNKAFAWFNLGNCQAQNENYPQAIVAYRRAIEEAPQFTRPWLILGDIYVSLDAVGDAVVCYKRVLEQEDDDVYAWKWLGESALRAGDMTEAMKSFDAALRLDPDQTDVYFALAETYAKIRDYESAQEVLKEAILLSPNIAADIYYYLGHLYEQSGDIRKAVRTYEEGLALEPKNTNIYFRVARIHLDAGSEFLALLTLELAINSGIKDPDIHLERGRIFFRQSRLENALDEFQKALSLGGIRGRDGIENVSAAFWNQGEKEKAEEILNSIK